MKIKFVLSILAAFFLVSTSISAQSSKSAGKKMEMKKERPSAQPQQLEAKEAAYQKANQATISEQEKNIKVKDIPALLKDGKIDAKVATKVIENARKNLNFKLEEGTITKEAFEKESAEITKVEKEIKTYGRVINEEEEGQDATVVE